MYMGLNEVKKQILHEFTMELYRDEYVSLNDRYYQAGFWAKIIDKYKEKFHAGMLGMLNKQMEREINDCDLRSGQVSHVIKEVWMEDNVLYGKVSVINTIAGNALYEAIQEGRELVSFPSGYGNIITLDGKMIVDVDSYVLESFDIFIDYRLPKEAKI